MGSVALEKAGVPSTQVPRFIEYLHQFPDNLQKYLFKFIRKNPLMSIDELKGIPVEVNITKINPEMEVLVKRISEESLEREWLRKLVVSGRFKKEDSVKLYNLVTGFHSLESDKKLTDFIDDTELSKFVNDSSVVDNTIDLSQIESGYTLFDSESIRGKDVKLYYVTEQEALDAIGGDASWCVLGGSYSYDPFEYYCFVIDGVAEVLLHQGSQQLKDRNDAAVSNARTINLIKPFIDKHNLTTHTMNDGDMHYDDDGMNDYVTYGQVSEKIDAIKSYTDDQLRELIYNSAEDFTLIAEEKWDGLIGHLWESLTSWRDEWDREESAHHVARPFSNLGRILSDLGYEITEKLATYVKLNGTEEDLDALANGCWATIKDDERNLTAGRYKKLVPPVLRTPKMNESVQRAKEDAMSSWRAKLTNDYTKLDHCPFAEVKEDESIKEDAFNEFKKKLLSAPKFFTSKYGYKTGFSDELKRDPVALKALLTEGWVNVLSIGAGGGDNDWSSWHDCPPDIRSNPEVQQALSLGINREISDMNKLINLRGFWDNISLIPDDPNYGLDMESIKKSFQEKAKNILSDAFNTFESESKEEYVRGNKSMQDYIDESDLWRFPNQLIDVLNEDAELRAMLVKCWDMILASRPSYLMRCPYLPEIVKENESLITEIEALFKNYSRLYSPDALNAVWVKFGPELQNVPRVRDGYFELLKNLLSTVSNSVTFVFKNIPEEFKKNEELVNLAASGFISRWNDSLPFSGLLESCPVEFYPFPDVQYLFKDTFIYYLQYAGYAAKIFSNEDLSDAEWVPEFLRNDPDIIKIFNSKKASVVNPVAPAPSEPAPAEPIVDVNASGNIGRLWSSSFNNNFIGKIL